MIGAIATNASPVTLEQTTPISSLTAEFEVIVVPADSEYQTLDDLIAAFKADPAAISWGGGSAGGTDHILVGLIAQAAGVDPTQINYVPFSGGGEALAAILGGQVSAGVSGVGEWLDQIESGELRALAVSGTPCGAKRRRTPVASADADAAIAPTLQEQGIDVELANWRGVVAPPEISDEGRQCLIAMVEQMVASEGWGRRASSTAGRTSPCPATSSPPSSTRSGSASRHSDRSRADRVTMALTPIPLSRRRRERGVRDVLFSPPEADPGEGLGMRGRHAYDPPPPSRRSISARLLLALGAIVFGILIIWQTTQIRVTPAYSKVGPRVIPVHRRRGIGDRRRLAGVRGPHRPRGRGQRRIGGRRPHAADRLAVHRSPGAGPARLPAPHRAGRVHHRQRDPLRLGGLRHGQPAPRARYRHRCHAGDSPLSVFTRGLGLSLPAGIWRGSSRWAG